MILVSLLRSELTRLCDLAELCVEVVLVLSSPPDEDVLNYWNKILEVRLRLG